VSKDKPQIKHCEWKEIEQIHKDWDDIKQPGMPSRFAAEHFDLLLNHIYDRDEHIALLENQVEDPTFLRTEAPPTDRPDVEGILTAVNVFQPVDGIVPVCLIDLLSVCDYTLDLEKRLKAVTKQAQDQYILLCTVNEKKAETDSLLADLVEACRNNRFGHWRWCAKSENPEGHCTCGYDDLSAALTAAKARLAEMKGAE
jgi:hypothetical protein